MDVCDVMESSVTLIAQMLNKDNNHDELEAMRRILNEVLQCAILVENELEEGHMLLEQLRSLQSSLIDREEYIFLSQAISGTRERGRPPFPITSSQVLFFFQHGCKINDVASLFGCSRRTVERRLQDVGVSVRGSYSQISDGNLSDLVRQMVRRNPRIGEKTVDGFLRAQHIVVQRQRIRDLLHSVDPEGSQRRLRRALNRREYHVEHANSLWHVDGYHKLIRWGIVVHGGIDGYSRLVTHMKAATNNKAETAFRAFCCGTTEYGIPDRVRTDKGGENIMIAEFMIIERGANRGSVISGRSVHNQRIERLWRDLFTDCVSFFYYLFYSMESVGLLNQCDPRYLYALHIVFLSKIQFQLNLFRSGWNNHKLRTEHNRTPLQLWISGIRHDPYEVHVRIFYKYMYTVPNLSKETTPICCHYWQVSLLT